MASYFKKKFVIDLWFVILELACLTGLWMKGPHQFIGMVIGNIIFWMAYSFIETKKQWEMPIYVRMMVILAILSNGILGFLFRLYFTSPTFDRIQHIIGTYALDFWFFYLVQLYSKITFCEKRVRLTLLILFAVGLGAVYEIVEFFVDYVTKPPIKNQPSLLDTDLDLISDFIGGILAALHFESSRRLKNFMSNYQTSSKTEPH